MVSDVPVGLFLSGGVDSGALLATTAAAGVRPAATLCMDFVDSEASEFDVASLSAAHFRVPLIRAPMTRLVFEDGLDRFTRLMDQPTNDGYNTHFIAQVARETGIKVWLSGVGGDELFGGYPSFRRMSWLPNWIALAAHLPGGYNVGRRVSGLSPRGHRISHLARPGDPSLRAYQASRMILPPAIVWRLLNPDYGFTIHELESLADELYPGVPDRCDHFQAATFYETSVYMASQLLRDIDNFSMAASLEVRAPFLDHDLFSSVLELPAATKLNSTAVKPLLVASVPGGLAPAVQTDRKHGFTFPLEAWLREDLALRSETNAHDPAYYEHLHAAAASTIWRKWKRGRVHWSVPWLLHAFGSWRKEHAC
jgi:asparagine synthase (glutamine-hydrolysing)